MMVLGGGYSVDRSLCIGNILEMVRRGCRAFGQLFHWL